MRAVDVTTGVGLAITAGLLLLALLAPWVAPADPYATDPGRALRGPSLAHPFGTGVFGEDIWSRVLWGARLDLLIAGGAVAIALVLGASLGALSGFVGGLADEGLMRAMDVLQAFPNFILALGIAAALGPSLPNLIVAIALTNVPVYARLMRSQVLTQRRAPYALAAVGVGNPVSRVLVVHLLPNTWSPILVQATLQAGWAILQAAGLSFIGLGVPVPTPEWGVMIAMGVQQVTAGQWWVAFFPGLAIMVAVIGLNLLGDGLQEWLDPRRH
jgi:peptide/nickel transport system permease protein